MGPDNLPIEVWQCLGEEEITFLCVMPKKISKEEDISEPSWKSTLILIYKNKGDIIARNQTHETQYETI